MIKLNHLHLVLFALFLFQAEVAFSWGKGGTRGGTGNSGASVPPLIDFSNSAQIKCKEMRNVISSGMCPNGQCVSTDIYNQECLNITGPLPQPHRVDAGLDEVTEPDNVGTVPGIQQTNNPGTGTINSGTGGDIDPGSIGGNTNVPPPPGLAPRDSIGKTTNTDNVSPTDSTAKASNTYGDAYGSEKCAKETFDSNNCDGRNCASARSALNACLQQNASAKNADQETAAQESACTEAITQANDSCDANKDSGMRTMMDSANGITSGLNRAQMMTSGGYGNGYGGYDQMGNYTGYPRYGASSMGACSQIDTLASGANSAMLAYKANCSSKVNECVSSCTPENRKARCNDAKARLQGWDQNFNGLVRSAAAAQNCAKTLASSGYGGNGYAGLGSLGSGVTPAVDCVANPTAGVCVCATNPSSAACQLAMAKLSGTGTGGGGYGATSEGAGSGGGLSASAKNGLAGSDMNFNIGGEDFSLHGGGAGAGAEDPLKGGAQNATMPRGSGGGAAPGAAAKAGAPAASNAAISRGYYGGLPMGNNAATPASGGGSAANIPVANKAADPNLNAKNDPKFLKLLQDSLQNRRRLAGIAGPDGIACAGCGSPFAAVARAYDRHATSLKTGPND